MVGVGTDPGPISSEVGWESTPPQGGLTGGLTTGYQRI